MSALQKAKNEEHDSDSDDLTPQLNLLQMVNTFHKPNRINKLMYVLVQVNGAVVRAIVDTEATECCLSNSIAVAVGLTVEPYLSVVVPLKGEDHRVDGMARAVPFRMGDWTDHCEFMVMSQRDFELVLGMDFLMAAKVGILPYLGSLAFLEFGTPYVVKTVPMEEEPNFTDFDSGSGTAADELTRSAMLAGAHTSYELKENIMSASVPVMSWGRDSEVRAGVSVGRFGVKECLPGGAQGERRELFANRGLDNEEGCWPTLRKLVGSWSHFPDEP